MLICVNEAKARLADMIAQHCKRWSDATYEDFDAFVHAVALHVHKSGGVLEFRVDNAKTGGLAFKGTATVDFLWVAFTTRAFSAATTERLRNAAASGLTAPLAKRQHADVIGWQELAELAKQAHDFAIAMKGKTHGLYPSGNCNSILDWLGHKPASLPPDRFPSTSSGARAAASIPPVCDIRQVCSDIFFAMTDIASKRGINGFTPDEIAAMPAVVGLSTPCRDEALAVLCKDGRLIYEDSHYLTSFRTSLTQKCQDIVDPMKHYINN